MKFAGKTRAVTETNISKAKSTSADCKFSVDDTRVSCSDLYSNKFKRILSSFVDKSYEKNTERLREWIYFNLKTALIEVIENYVKNLNELSS